MTGILEVHSSNYSIVETLYPTLRLNVPTELSGDEKKVSQNVGKVDDCEQSRLRKLSFSVRKTLSDFLKPAWMREMFCFPRFSPTVEIEEEAYTENYGIDPFGLYN